MWPWAVIGQRARLESVCWCERPSDLAAVSRPACEQATVLALLIQKPPRPGRD